MTNAEINNLKSGDVIRSVFNGIRQDMTILTVKMTGICSNPRSGAYGHAFASIEYRPAYSATSVYGTCIESDEYTNGSGHRTHDAAGARTFGYDVVR